MKPTPTKKRREIISLASQLLHQGPLSLPTLTAFILTHQLTPEEVCILQSEVMTTVVVMFSSTLIGTSLLGEHTAEATTQNWPKAMPAGQHMYLNN